jgi:glycerol-3-phosphate acyltransferase PlsY
MLIKILYIILGYLLGSIPFAYIIAKKTKNIDIYSMGSGNPGATNVFRVIGKTAGIFTFIADILKGFIPVYFATFVCDSLFYSFVVALVTVLGHMFTVFLKFKGGKGVATGFGVFLALIFWPSLIAFVVFYLIFMVSGYISLGSICATLVFPSVCYFLGYSREVIIFAFCIVLLIIYKHKENIKRLKDGSENKFKIFKRK